VVGDYLNQANSNVTHVPIAKKAHSESIQKIDSEWLASTSNDDREKAKTLSCSTTEEDAKKNSGRRQGVTICVGGTEFAKEREVLRKELL